MYKLATISILAASVFMTSSALAVETGCSAPSSPTLPASITTQAEAESLEASTITYLENASTYQQCLVDWANANDASLTDEDRSALRSLYDTQANASKAYSEEWNAKLSAFLAS